MADINQDIGCGCWVLLVATMVGIYHIKGCYDENKSRDLKPDYSSRRSEEGRFVNRAGNWYTPLGTRDFYVADGIGYLTLQNGYVLKMWRNGYGEYEGRYNGRSYTAKKTENGYEIRLR